MQDLEQFKNEMNLSGKNVYVGHRYKPKMFGEWDKTNLYEPLSIVQYQGASYTSRQYVPVGIEITNEEYWALTGNYNAQVEQYRQDVRNLNTTVSENSSAISEINSELSIVDKKLDELEMVNAKAFDVVGDGIKDDTVALQAAFDYSSVNKKTLIIPKGTYLIDAEKSLFVKSDSHIIFKDGAQIQIKPNANTNYTAIKIENAENVKIEGGLLIGDRYEHYHDEVNNPWKMWQPNKLYYAGELVYRLEKGYRVLKNFTSGAEFTTENLNLEVDNVGEWGHAIHIRGSENVVIKNLKAKDFWGDGIVVGGFENVNSANTPSKRVFLLNIESFNNRRNNVTVGHADGVYGYGCELHGANGTMPQDGIDVEANRNDMSSNVVFEKCIIYGNLGSGVSVVFRGENITFRDNAIFDNGRANVAIGGNEDDTISNILVDNNFISGAEKNGMEIYSVYPKYVRDVTVSNNKFTENITAFMGRSIRGLKIKDNIFEANQVQNIYVYDNSENVVIENNKITGKGTDTRSLYFVNVNVLKIINNIFDKVDHTLAMSNVDTFEISSNENISKNIIQNCKNGKRFGNSTVEDVSGYKLSITGSENIKVYDDTFKGTGNGIWVGDTCTHTKVYDIDFGMPSESYKINDSGTNSLISTVTGSWESQNVPTKGTWERGQTFYRPQPTVGSPIGWVCTVAGTPGTWVSLGNL